SITKIYKFTVQPTRGEKEQTAPLPKFKPIKLSEILRTTTGKSNLNITSDVMAELIERIHAQQVELLRGLDIDEENPDWADAFLQLACVHHGMGVIHVDKARPPNKHAAKWTREQDQALLAEMNARLESGKTATAALKEIASDKSIWRQFPNAKNFRSDKPPAF